MTATDEHEAMTRTWRVEALLTIPRFVDTPGERLPEAMQLGSVIPIPITATRGGLGFTLDNALGHPFAELVPFAELFAHHELARLRTTVTAAEAQGALTAVAPPLEELIDFLAFQLQQPIPVVQLELLDITQPVQTGDKRDGVLFPAPGGYPFPKQQSSLYLGPARVSIAPTLEPPPNWAKRHVRAARDWYLKGLHASSDPDRFMLFWISMEVLFDQSGIRILESPRCSHGHLQPEMACPECGELNMRMVRGGSIKEYLTTRCGISADDATNLWKVRQMFHGAVDFDSRAYADLPRLTIVLQAATLDRIKDVAGARADLATIQPGGMTIAAMALGILREVQARDL